MPASRTVRVVGRVGRKRRPVARVGLLQHVHHQRSVRHAHRVRADVRDRAERREGMRRHTAEAPLEAEVPAERCRDAHRAGAVAADAQRREPRGDRRCCPAGGPAARLARIPRVSGDAGHRRVGLALAAELGRRGLADEDRPGLPEAGGRWRVDIPRLVGVDGEAPPSGRPPSREDQVLDRRRHTIEGTHRLTPLPTRLARPAPTPTPSPRRRGRTR